MKTVKQPFFVAKGPDELVSAYQTHINKPQNKTEPTKILLWARFKFWEYFQRVSYKPKGCNPKKPVTKPSKTITPPEELGLTPLNPFIIFA